MRLIMAIMVGIASVFGVVPDCDGAVDLGYTKDGYNVRL